MDDIAKLMQKGVVLAELQQALQIVRQAGYRVSKPKRLSFDEKVAKVVRDGEIKTVNPLGHSYPHAKLYNEKLTSITRLNKNTEWLSNYMTK